MSGGTALRSTRSSVFESDQTGQVVSTDQAEATSKSSSPNAKLLNRFYEPLHLLCMLNPDRGSGEVDLPPESQSRDFRTGWRRFLDDLSSLCDNRHGGETVSAVAAQDLPESINFWLASKHEASYHHLKCVLAELKGVRDQTNDEMTATAVDLAAKSIVFSKDKVKTYKRFLKLALGKVIQTPPDLKRHKTEEVAQTGSWGSQLLDVPQIFP